MNGVVRSRNIIGSLIVVVSVMAFAAAAEPHVELVIRDANGVAAKQIAVGVPAILEVHIHDVQGEIDKVMIEGVGDASLHKQGVTRRVNTINGQASSIMIYRYGLRFDHKGSYTVGPARVFWAGQELVSDKKTILVAKAVKQTTDAPSVRLELSVDKTSMVVGESTKFRVRFFPGTSGGSLAHISPPDLERFTHEDLQGPFSGSIEVNGATDEFLEWSCELVAKEPGSVVIPAIVGEYRVARSRGSLFDDDMFGGLFSFGANLKKVNSNSIEVQVVPLPHHTPPVQAVGVFHQLTASLEQSVAHENEGIVLTLVLEGQENVSKVAAPLLVMPAGIRSYESKAQVHKSSSRALVQKKNFEYVLQGIAAGTYTIPAQLFTYFDTTDRKVKSLATEPLELLILQSKQKTSPFVPQLAGATTSPIAITQTSPVSLALERSLVTSQHSETSAWWLFWLLMSLPLIGAIIFWLHHARGWNFAWYTATYRYWFAFATANRSIKHIAATEQLEQLYNVFLNLFATRTHHEPTALSAESLVMLLRSKTDDANLVYSFENFIARCELCTFGHKQTMTHDEIMALLEEARTWLRTLKKIL